MSQNRRRRTSQFRHNGHNRLSRSKLSFFIFLVLVVAACPESSPEAANKAPDKPPEPTTGQRVLFQMYGAARAWAPDVQGLRLESISLLDVPSAEGRYPAWRATFISPSRRQSKPLTYSVVEAHVNL